MKSSEPQVVIVGGGTAGTAAALELARRGVPCRVLHQRGAHQNDHSALVPRSLRNAWWTAGDQRGSVDIDRLELRTGRQRTTLDHVDLTIVGQRQWSTDLRVTRAAAAIAETEGRLADIRTCSIDLELDVITADRKAEVWHARHVILATGPPSRKAGHVCGLWVGEQAVKLPRELGTPLLILPPANFGQHELTACTVSVTPSPEDSHLATMRAVRYLDAAASDRLIEQTLAHVHHHLRLAESPEPIGTMDTAIFCRSCTTGAERAGQLNVGGAAGLVNPFTGDGIQFAATSGKLAAEAIALHLDNPLLAQRRYRRQLQKSLIGLGEGSERSVHRAHLTRQVLIDTINDERPFFAKARRAILLAPGIGGLAPADKLGSKNSATLLLKPFTLACDEVVSNAVRQEWPLLASVLRQSPSNSFELRPSSLFGLSYLAAGGRELPRWSSLAAAIELSNLGALALLTSGGGRQPAIRQIDFHCAAATLAGDFLLARSSKIASQFGSSIAASLSSWLEEIIAARLDGTAGAGMFASIFEMPARLAASLAGADQDVVDALSSYGSNFGAALSHAEDALALVNRRTRLDTTTAGLIAADLSNVRAPTNPSVGPEVQRHQFKQSLEAARQARGSFVAASIRALDIGMQADPRCSLVQAAQALLLEDLDPPTGTSTPPGPTTEGRRALA